MVAQVPPPDHGVAALLTWYAHHRRDLPWRRTREPYAILLSEVMLQQTQVQRVIPKYLEFLERFPDFPTLAAASPGEVIRAWAPLGYNQRAVRLWRIAQRAVAEHGGRLPQDPSALRELPGVGEYTASAVACFAFGWQVPVIDTNVRRVLRRLSWGVQSPSPGEIATLAGEMLPPGRAQDWNQALMDLGATVCTSRRPQCAACPLRSHCQAAPRLAKGHPAIAEERARYRAVPFKGSSRYYRGRILHVLRELQHGQGLPILELGRGVKPGFTEGELPWLQGLLAGLDKDGLVRIAPAAEGGGVSLP